MEAKTKEQIKTKVKQNVKQLIIPIILLAITFFGIGFLALSDSFVISPDMYMAIGIFQLVVLAIVAIQLVRFFEKNIKK